MVGQALRHKRKPHVQPFGEMFHQRTKELCAGSSRRSLNDRVKQQLRALSLDETAVYILACEWDGKRLRFTFGFCSAHEDFDVHINTIAAKPKSNFKRRWRQV